MKKAVLGKYLMRLISRSVPFVVPPRYAGGQPTTIALLLSAERSISAIVDSLRICHVMRFEVVVIILNGIED